MSIPSSLYGGGGVASLTSSLVCICMCNVSSQIYLIKENLNQLWTNTPEETLLATLPCVLTFGFTTWHSLPYWLSCHSKPVQLGNGRSVSTY